MFLFLPFKRVYTWSDCPVDALELATSLTPCPASDASNVKKMLQNPFDYVVFNWNIYL